MPDQVVQFEGTEHHFPDDFSQQDIAKALSAAHPLPPAMNKVPIPPGLGQPEDEGLFKRIYLAPARALTEDIPNAIAQYTRPGFDAKAGATAKLASGLATAAAPFTLPEAAIAAPALTAASLGGATLGGAVGQGAAEVAGLPEGASELAGTLGSIAGGGLPSAVEFTGAGPRLRAGSKEALEQIRKELPEIKRWQKYGTAGGYLAGGGIGHPFIGSEVGLAAGTARAVPPAFRGFRKGFSGYEPPLTNPMPPPPGTPAARFVPGQYDLKVANAPIEVGGAHIPDYNGPVASPIPPELAPAGLTGTEGIGPLAAPGPLTIQGSPEIPAVLPGGSLPEPLAKAAATGQSGAVPSILDDISKSLGGKKYSNLGEHSQAVVRSIAEKIDPQSATAPAPEATPARPERVTYQSPLPKSQQERAMQWMATHQTTKNAAVGQYFMKQGITPEDIAKMSDAEFDSHVTKVKSPLTGKPYEPSRGVHLSREKSEARNDVMNYMRGANPINAKPIPPK